MQGLGVNLQIRTGTLLHERERGGVEQGCAPAEPGCDM